MSVPENVNISAGDMGKLDLDKLVSTGTEAEEVDKEIAQLQAERDGIRERLLEAWKRRDKIVKDAALASDLKMMREKHGVDFAPTQELRVGGIESKPAVGTSTT